MAPDGALLTARREEILARLTRLHPRLIDLSLGRTLRLLEKLGRPDRKLPPVVHVAGTNGKGSTIAFLRAMHEAEGRRVHVYTSPHLVRINECLRLAGRLIEDDVLIALLTEIEAVNAGEPITVFEIATVAAFAAMAREPADIVLLETGLGGRNDATNVVERPALTLLTPISLDHQEFLGPTLAAIAGEKAAIQKPGAPSLVAVQPAEAMAVIRDAAQTVGAPLRQADVDWRVDETADGPIWHSGNLSAPMRNIALAGRHQRDNAALAIAASQTLPDLPVSREAVLGGLASAEWPARLQRLRGALARRIGGDWSLWLDGGHNAAAAAALAESVRAWHSDGVRPLHLVCGMIASKDAEAFLAPLAPLATSLTAVPVPGPHRHHAPRRLAEIALGQGISATTAGNVGTALDRLAARASGNVLICGSLYLAGAVLAADDPAGPT
ncbi:MAG: folylpolyglutamate synthase/dihydrofolate synthase family protein [Alphaproteobacteria bacterium]|jgi:dihydrofolate synthase/folylpolyglutamate synthase